MLYAKKARAIVAALTLTLTLVAPTFAATDSKQVAETLTVNASITLANVPASLAYGSTLGAQKLSATMTGVRVATNNPSGMKVTASATDLTAGAGKTIAATNRALKFGGSAEVPYTGSSVVLTNFTTATDMTADIVSSVNVPADAVPGAYTGTLTISVATNP